jgi:hypothetical protein
MTAKHFYNWLALLSLGTALLLAGLHYALPPMQAHAPFSVATLLLFAAVCAGLFHAGRQAAGSSNKYAFSNLVSVSVFGKMVLALAFLFLYQRIFKPENNWFVSIFLLCYVAFTVFEVWFMSKLART